MLYIFHVDTGTMMTFDMSLALESVSQLKDVIEKSCRIPSEKQVLLVSGGDSLEPSSRVCSYSAGTDTNPIYLFSKCTIESLTPPSPSIDYGSDLDLKEQVEGSLSMPATYNTVVVRAQLAQQLYELAREQTRICERLVHDQHLQQQGWAAVVANLDDITAAFRSRAEIFEQSFNQYLQTRAEFIQLLQNFSDDLTLLAKIPMIPTLLTSKEETETEVSSSKIQDDKEECEIEKSMEGSKITKQNVEKGSNDHKESNTEEGGLQKLDQNVEAQTLLQWISAKDNQSSLDQVADICNRGLEQFDNEIFEALKSDVRKALDTANNQKMKEIKGLGERLFGLEQLMFETKRIVQEQGDLAQAFLQNQNRASNLGDPSILPDLCASHWRQLLVMLKNHQQLRDIRRRCTRAKEELSTNLHTRLRWVMFVENCMCETDNKLMIYHENLKRLRRSLEVLQQIHLSPQMYMSAVAEVVRRRTFSQAFLVWASDFACQLLAVHNEEVARRKDFQNQFEGHFLNTLFPGMEDFPPSYATQAPSSFDCKLPKLSMEDVERLRAELPEFDISVSLPDLGAITQFFLVRSVTGIQKTEDRETALEDRLAKVVSEAGLESNLDPTLLQPAEGETAMSLPSPCPISLQETAPSKEQDRGFESETDTEEFEKVGQSPVKQSSSQAGSDPAAGAKEEGASSSVVTTLEENLGNTRDEVERLRANLVKAGHLVFDSASKLRDDVSSVRMLTRSELQTIQTKMHEVSAAIGQHMVAIRIAEETRHSQERCSQQAHERELIQRLTVDHELEMDALKKEVKASAELKDEEIRKLKQALDQKEQKMILLRADMERRLEEEVNERREVAQNLESQLNDTRQQCNELQRRLDAAEADKQRALKDIQDRLADDQKTEIERLSSRFRLMANASMERSPSDSSLEKIERPGVIELVNHEAIMAQIREDMTAEQEAAVKAAVEQERIHWEARLDQELKQARSRSEAEKQVWFNEAMRRVVGEKERQVEALRAREASLMVECQRHQDTIRRLTDDRDSSSAPSGLQGYGFNFRSLDSNLTGVLAWPLLDRLERLETEKKRLELELAKERNRKSRTLSETAASESGDEQKPTGSAEMSSSVAVVQDAGASRDVATSPEPLHRSLQGEHLKEKLTRSTTYLTQEGKISISSDAGASRDVATSPEPLHRSLQGERLKEKLTRSATSLIQDGKISISSCNVGDAVLVMWDKNYQNYTILQDTTTLYFLHSDCLDTLGLHACPVGSPHRLYSTGEVIGKNFCYAKKSENRYNVPQGTKFYRVMVRPLQKESSLVRSQRHHHQHHQQQPQQGSSSNTSSSQSTEPDSAK